MRVFGKYLILMLLLTLFSCGEKKPNQPQPISKQEMKNSMEKANRYLLNEEQEDIENYVKRHGLDMTTTGTGLRYQILKQGSERKIEKGEKVSLEYELHSIAGDLIYSSENDGIKTFVVGEGAVESGLDEAMTYLHRGDVAKIIIPFHLGYGLHGDDDKIPEYATLVYTIEIKDNQ
jgi:FKBP-type peptidyl-prolyl cis-trans isomerase